MAKLGRAEDIMQQKVKRLMLYKEAMMAQIKSQVRRQLLRPRRLGDESKLTLRQNLHASNKSCADAILSDCSARAGYGVLQMPMSCLCLTSRRYSSLCP